MKKSVISTALAAVFGVATMNTQAATLNAGDILTVNSGIPVLDGYGYVTGIESGSWFGMDSNGDGEIQQVEQGAVTGLNGITIGSMQGPNEIDTWELFNFQGTHYTTTAPAGGTDFGIDMSGWMMFWNGVDVSMNFGAWTPGNCGAGWMGCTGETFSDGVASFSWSGIYGDAYTLWYSATVPDGDASGLSGSQFIVYYEGVVLSEIPVPAAVWLLGSGLLTLVGIARRPRVVRAGA